MNMLTRGAAATVAVVSLGACTVSGNMYPLNPNAQALGAPRFEFVRQGTDNGPLKVTMPDGEVLQGRYQVARDAALLGFGNFSATGTRGAVSGFSNATVVGVGGGTAFASAMGRKPRSIASSPSISVAMAAACARPPRARNTRSCSSPDDGGGMSGEAKATGDCYLPSTGV